MNHADAGPYQACGFFLLRAPALPARPMLDLLSSLPGADRASGGSEHSGTWQDDYADRLLKLWGAPGVADAVRVATPDLADAVDRFDGLTGKDRRRAVRSLGRYLNRMSFRATPLGLVAGVATGVFGDEQRMRLGPSAIGRARARADSGWVMHLVKRLASRAPHPAPGHPRTRPGQLRIRSNDLLHVARGRVWLPLADAYGQDGTADVRPDGPGTPDRHAHAHDQAHEREREHERAPRRSGSRSVSVRLTAPVRAVLDLTRTPVTLDHVAATLNDAYPQAGSERIAALLDGLLDNDILITAERLRLLTPPAMDTPDEPLRSLLPAVTDPTAARALGDVAAAIDAFNRDGIPVPELLEAADAPLPLALGGHRGPTLQIDSALAVDGPLVLPRPVAALAEEAAEVLARVGGERRYPPHLAAYADALSERYGHLSEVPLLDVLSAETGLGPPRGYRCPRREFPLPGVDRNPPARSAREAVLARLAATALARRETGVELDDRLLDELAEASAAPDGDRPPPPALDLYLRPMPPGPGQERWRAVCNNLGVALGGRTFARFHDLLDADIRAGLHELAVAEERSLGDTVCAELTYLPGDARQANVAIRPAAHAWELPVNVTPGRDEEHVLRLDDVLVGAAEGRLHLRSRTLGRPLHVTQRTLLNWLGAPNPCRFLLEVSAAQSGPVSSFDWGELAETMPFLPRVERGDLVLRRARWRLRPHDLTLPPGAAPTASIPQQGDGIREFAASVDTWSTTWMVPRLVNLVSFDNTLLLDLTSAPGLHELRDSLARSPAEGLLLEEVLPDPERALLRDAADEPYAAEVVVPVLRRAGRDQAPAPGGTAVRPAGVRTSEPPDGRHKPVGSDWLTVKLYAEPDAHDRLLEAGLPTVAERIRPWCGADALFFVRYADPAPHLRVRFFVPDQAARPEVLREVTAWAYDLAAEGHIVDHSFVGYEREVERYGGGELIADAEEFFRHDSTAVLPLLRHLRDGGSGLPHTGPAPFPLPGTDMGLDAERVTLAALSVDRLCAHLIPEAEARRDVARAAAPRTAGGSLYRAAGPGLWAARTTDNPVRSLLDGADAAWRPAARPLARRLAEPERTGRPEADRAAVVRSLLHMHCNRMGLSRTEEESCHGVWRRLLDRAAHLPR
ncbi:lantibiotic dehydratase [Streptomyces sp. NPDC059009]|uniref:lantibiotic dehydratase n=1 Tax=Streptomyces sp. NPDC059009 TaxID=3346694 RepID=UPI003675518C